MLKAPFYLTFMTSSRRLSLPWHQRGEGEKMMFLPANITRTVICLIMRIRVQKHNCFILKFIGKLVQTLRVDLHQFQISNRLAPNKMVRLKQLLFFGRPNPFLCRRRYIFQHNPSKRSEQIVSDRWKTFRNLRSVG